jgi:murein DD-endopeptidase MepM/ murein hydrolase activator NlpD
MPPPTRDSRQPSNAPEKSLPRRWLEERVPIAFARLAVAVYRLSGDYWRDWRPLLTRFSAHAAVLIVAVVGIALSSIDWPAQAGATLSASAALPALGSREQSENKVHLVKVTTGDRAGALVASQTTDVVFRRAQPHTTIPDRPRLEIVTYTVQAGDTVQLIADQFALEPTTIMWANPAIEDAPDLLRIGQQVIILPIDGVYHQVDEGDTLASIAEKYEVEPDAIVSCKYNSLETTRSAIQPGEYLIIPGGEKPYEPKVVTAYSGSVPQGARGTGRFQWPVLGTITQGYWYGHRAIDIGAPAGSAVLATDGGFISFAGWTDVGYGYLIVVDHANGFATYYAHLSNIYVVEGQAVDRGKVIGAVGNTGNSTGPHLHFEVRRSGIQQNPRAYLP